MCAGGVAQGSLCLSSFQTVASFQGGRKTERLRRKQGESSWRLLVQSVCSTAAGVVGEAAGVLRWCAACGAVIMSLLVCLHGWPQQLLPAMEWGAAAHELDSCAA